MASYVFGLIVLAPFLIMFGLGANQLNFEHLTSSEGVPIQWAALLSLVLWTSSGWDDVGQVCMEGEERRMGEIEGREAGRGRREEDGGRREGNTLLVVNLVFLITHVLQLAGEIKEPAKNFPRAMIVTMFIVIVMYMLPLAVGMLYKKKR